MRLIDLRSDTATDIDDAARRVAAVVGA